MEHGEEGSRWVCFCCGDEMTEENAESSVAGDVGEYVCEACEAMGAREFL